VELALFTGMRRGELLELIWERVDRARGVVLLEVTKSGRRREVPLNSRADAVLARRGSHAHGLVFGSRNWNAYRHAFEGAATRAKLTDFRFHDLRHTFASWAVQRGATLQEVKDLLGHSTLAMVTLRASEPRAPPQRGCTPRCRPSRHHFSASLSARGRQRGRAASEVVVVSGAP